MKGFLLGAGLLVIIAFVGLVYRNAAEHPAQPIACPMDARLCPDGTSVGRTGNSCNFPTCPPPNVSLADAGISFAVPAGFSAVALPDAPAIAAYGSIATSTGGAEILIRRYAIEASSTALAVIRQTAIRNETELPVAATAFSYSGLGGRSFTVALIERFNGTIDTAYYLVRGTDVVRFDAIDTGVSNWSEAALDLSALPAHVALTKLLTTLQGQ